MTRLGMNIVMLALLYMAGVWVWQNLLPSGVRTTLSSASSQAFGNMSANLAPHLKSIQLPH